MEPLTWILLAAVVAMPAAYFWQRQQPAPAAPRARQRVAEARDTVADWPPTATRVLNDAERKAFELLRQALPDHLVLAQVSLSRFIRVPTRNSYGDWLGRVGQLSADLVVCDPSSQVVAVVEVRTGDGSAGSTRRHQRMTRVLKAAGVHVSVWNAGQLPPPQAVRAALFPEEAARLAADQAARHAAAEAARLTGAAPRAPGLPALPDTPNDPPPTTWYGELEGPRLPAGDAREADDKPPR
jgi:Protein of unknown function (DUF2726)